MALSSTGIPNLGWVEINSNGPQLYHHVGCMIGNNIYIHGGINKKGSTHALNRLFKYDVSANSWSEISASGSPSLSHHACVPLENRYLLLIGGWDGKQRTSDIYAFDIKEQQWMCPKCSGFPAGAGLSSHTATLLSDGNILIIGREGSLRTQRRSGNSFMLRGNIGKSFKYDNYSLGVASRSGHTTTPLVSRLVTVGGRSDKIVEQYQGFYPVSPVLPEILSKLSSIMKDTTPMTKLPCGRKHHIATAGHKEILVHGGETFDGKSRDPVGDLFLIKLDSHLSWYKLGASDIGREGHVATATPQTIVIHGGAGPRNIIFNQVYQLNL